MWSLQRHDKPPYANHLFQIINAIFHFSSFILHSKYVEVTGDKCKNP